MGCDIYQHDMRIHVLQQLYMSPYSAGCPPAPVGATTTWGVVLVVVVIASVVRLVHAAPIDQHRTGVYEYGWWLLAASVLCKRCQS